MAFKKTVAILKIFVALNFYCKPCNKAVSLIKKSASDDSEEINFILNSWYYPVNNVVILLKSCYFFC